MSPAELGAAAAWIGANFIGAGADDFVRDFIVHAVSFTVLKRLLHAPILTRMKRKNRNPAAVLQTERKIAKQRFESAELIVHGDAQRLKHAAHGVVISSGSANQLCQLHR